jgi:hypothetical protein
VKILLQELLLLATSVVVLTAVLAAVQWRVGGPTYGATIGELGVKFGLTAYVFGAVVRLIFLSTRKFKKMAQSVRKA